MKFRETMSELFNWKKHPQSVFYLVVPLAVIGFGMCILEAVLQIITRGDWGYLIIFLILTPFMAMPVIMIVRLRKLFGKHGHF